MKIIVNLLYVLIVTTIFSGSYYIIFITKKENIKNKKNNKKTESYGKLNEIMKKRSTGFFSYDRINSYLKMNGNPMKISPAAYILIKCLSSIIVFILFSSDIIIAFVGSIIGFYLVNLIIYSSNKKDMDKIKIQIVDVYDFLSIQTAAGVFIGSALTECYLMVRNTRLKNAFAEMCAEINLTKDVLQSLEKFGKSFNSVEIDAFVLTIKQSLRTGKIEKALNDLSNSQKDSNIILIQQQTDKIGTSKDIIQLMMYFGILATIMFGLFAEISKGWNGLF
ncbi:hypothetical protein [Clostridium gasigenes]|uniref:Type II secretion system (T2SS), protein F n=1 Tax=Clostridium gasigenes TaxID=94869 RepID=A0A7X0SHX5_9CLOT|nr:hypothetical protein [Clostridium gasigenes]MBB6716648.1 hypothetical protein [Clostridium gasigenes]